MQFKQLKAVAVCLCLGLILAIGSVEAQENAQLNIPPSLIECYNTSYFMNRDNRLPANMDTLISLIEKVELSYAATGYQMDIRQISVALLHRFRQDGIKRAPGVTPVASSSSIQRCCAVCRSCLHFVIDALNCYYSTV